MTLYRRARAWCASTWATLRERLEPIPADDDDRLVDWVPTSSDAYADTAYAYPVSTADPQPVDGPGPVRAGLLTPAQHYAKLARSAAETVLVPGPEHPLEPTPIHDALVAEFAELEAAKLRALRTPTAEFWAIVDTLSGFYCTHCVDGDHVACPGCECACTLVGASA